ncbi:alpha-ketoglutarate-dependent dioxygenase AlkB [Chryseobacterium sp. MEBOG06]|uniref:alpha-ketoglutarate-dependent dioxygenase AlkB n=1 Tax=Chryseobacterium sp. MEBOG06 TaxID=2879938 RepID=UPI001F1DE143|nr:alpha-ketoglutarate-dependent dioxygenase AlkB [Chryseobacterium sp. MEBOG06]UKB86338.1 alpha-ketoglutarate-dependent dioxygenase AlkB [Chryseobacterium sp. MEBOG06]
MNRSDFQKIQLPLDRNMFMDLFHSAEFELTGKGRLGNHLVKVEGKDISIVRTTTRYHIPAAAFSEIHEKLIEQINATLLSENTEIPVQYFDNALIEVYDSTYSKMGFHSDQALDLESNSFIGLFSCYEQPDELEDFQLRKLVVKDKLTDEEFEIILHHNSVILFSVETNRKFQHKIVLNTAPDPKKAANDNKWLGITFRKSKISVQFNNEKPYFPSGEVLTLADKEQESEFFKLRGQENRSLDFVYPPLLYTISPGDMIPPVEKKNI